MENKRIFTKAEKEHLLKLATRQKIPMAIEIDMDADTVSFHFREDEEELQDLCDVTFSRYISREQKYDGSYCRQVLDNLMVSDMFDERDRHCTSNSAGGKPEARHDCDCDRSHYSVVSVCSALFCKRHYSWCGKGVR